MPDDTAGAALLPLTTKADPEPRVHAFLEPDAQEAFEFIRRKHQMWEPDPYDVPTLHKAARNVFREMLQRAAGAGTPAGRIFLLLGESGSGKTHLMRAFRNQVHRDGAGFCGYIHVATSAVHYGRYILRAFIDSMGQPYYPPQPATGLTILGNVLLEALPAILPREVDRLREESLSREELARFIHELADQVLLDDRFADIDLDLVRVLLYLQCGSASVRHRAQRYLRCEDLAPADRDVLGGLVPRAQDEDTYHLLELLGMLLWRVARRPLVLLIDQLEDIHHQVPEEATIRYKRLVSEVCALAEHVPSSILVVACQQDVYEARIRNHVSSSHLDRISKDPPPVVLSGNCTLAEVRELAGQRMRQVCEKFHVNWNPAQPTYPLPDALLASVQNTRTRQILEVCWRYQGECSKAGSLLPFTAAPLALQPEPVPSVELVQAWNDCLAKQASLTADATEEELADLLGKAITQCSWELPQGGHFAVVTDGPVLEIEEHDAAGNLIRRLVAGVCNKSTRSPALHKQVEAVRKRAGEFPLILVRRDKYPDPSSKVGAFLLEAVPNPHSRVKVEEVEWRTMLAMTAFLHQQRQHPQLADWLKVEQPLHQLRALQHILDLGRKRPEALTTRPTVPTGSSAPPKPTVTPPSRMALLPTDACMLGTTTGMQSRHVTIAPKELLRHAVFLGGTGSGKTTLALNLIEQLLLRGVPAVLVDRKGDLCCYARPEFWEHPPSVPHLDKRWRQLREKVDVRLFTPGKPSGNPLALPLVPEGLGTLESHERHIVAKQAASALGGMMGYKAGTSDKYGAILGETLEFLAELQSHTPVTLPLLIEALHSPEPALLDRLTGRAKHLDKLVEGLQTLKYNQQALLSENAPRLEGDLLFGKGRHAVPGKTRLSILSTKFLGDDASLQFWVAQLLLELARWLSRNPSNDLQAVLLLDEADQYMPATRKPASKEPLESLLKRARSGGLGIFLASQSPGDFDYKGRENLRTWFLGKITQDTAQDKLKSVVGDGKQTLLNRLSSLETGHFVMTNESNPCLLLGDRSALETQQLSEEEIVRLAHRSV